MILVDMVLEMDITKAFKMEVLLCMPQSFCFRTIYVVETFLDDILKKLCFKRRKI